MTALEKKSEELQKIVAELGSFIEAAENEGFVIEISYPNVDKLGNRLFVQTSITEA